MQASAPTRLVAGLIFSIMTVAAGCLPAQAAAPAAVVRPDSPDALRAALAKAMEEHAIPGASYAVFDRHATVLGGAIGLANADTKQAVGPATLFRIGSVTKTVTAIAVMQLIEQGRFDLQTPVAQLLPGIPIHNPYASTDPVRVVHLLTHSAGLDDTHAKGFFAATEQRGGHLATSLRQRESLAVRWRPGSYQSYSNPGYVLLGAILEAHYRQPWDAIVGAQVLLPLGMRDTAALASDAARRDHADGHSGQAMRPVARHPAATQADGALWTSATELAKLGRFLLTDGASAPGVLRPATIRAMKQRQGSDGARAGLAHGNGLGLRHRALANTRWQGHSGGVLGALASMHYNEELGMGYVVLVNSDNQLRSLERPLAGFIFRQAGWHSPPAPTVAAANDADGWYRSVNPRVSLLALPTFLLSSGKVSAEGDTLRMRAPLPGMGIDATLKHRGKGLLADVDDGEVITGAVLRGDDGKVRALELDGVYMERSSALAVLAPLASVLLALPLLLTAPFGRRGALRNPWMRRLPALAMLTLVAGIVCAANLKLELLAQVNWQTAGICAATTLFPLLALAALAVNLRGWKQETARVAKWRCLLGAIGAVIISLWLAAYHLVGFALWAW